MESSNEKLEDGMNVDTYGEGIKTI